MSYVSFIPALTSCHICTNDERILLSLPQRLGGVGIKIITVVAEFDYNNSIKVTNELTISILDQESRVNEANQQTGSYNWLTTLPLAEYNYNLNKEQFWDTLRLRYNWNIPRTPTECACGSKFTVQHALSCKKGGFITLRHNEVRYITSSFLDEVCKDVRKEPLLTKLTAENIDEKTAKIGDEARLDISVVGFWSPGPRVFCDIRVFDHNAQGYRNNNLQKSFIRNEVEKKKHYNERVLKMPASHR